jgi:hypothetical protein
MFSDNLQGPFVFNHNLSQLFNILFKLLNEILYLNSSDMSHYEI